MEIEKQALEYLVEIGKKLSEPIERTIDGRQYINKTLTAIDIPLRAAFEISTLGSLAELCQGKFENADGDAAFESFDPSEYVIHVVDEGKVQVVSAFSNAWAKREVLINCKLDESVGFKFGQYLSHEDFMVGVLANFTQTDDKDYILRIAANLVV